MIHLRLLAWSLMLVLGSSCLGPRVQTDILVKDPAFHRTGLNGKTVAFAPMMRHPRLSYIPNVVQFHLMQEELDSRFQEHFPRTRLLKAEDLQKAVGEASLTRLMENKAWIPCTPAQIQRLKDLGVDYLWVSFFQSNDLGNGVSQWTEDTTQTSEDAQGNETNTTFTTYYTSSQACRRMIVSSHLYGVLSGRCVWSAVSRDQRCQSNWVDSNHDYLDAPAFPDAPRETELMENIVKDVLKKLPR